MAKSQKSQEASATAIMADLERLARLMRQGSFAQGLNPVQWEALRYLAMANHFSNAPMAVAQYLGATKGTVSQTVAALAKKGLLVKHQRGSDARSLALSLTPEGNNLLANDPALVTTGEIARLGPKTAKRFAKALEELLAAHIEKQHQQRFGTCQPCRFSRKSKTGEDGIYCTFFKTEVPDGETRKLCYAFAPE